MIKVEKSCSPPYTPELSSIAKLFHKKMIRYSLSLLLLAISKCASLKNILVFRCKLYLLPLPLPNKLKHQESECFLLESPEQGVCRILARATSRESEEFLKAIESHSVKFHNSHFVGAHGLDSRILD